MAYIGKQPQTGAYSMLDALTASATASYSLTLDSVAFVPESPNHLIVSLNGHIQKAGSSYNVSSSTLTFSSALTSSDSIDFILALGRTLDIGTPSDATVTNAKTNFVSTSSAAGLQIKGDGTTDGTLQLNCSQNSHGIKLKSPAHSASASYTLTFPTTDGNNEEFLQTNGSGVLTWATAGGGITEADQYRLTATISSNVDPISSNLERVDDASFGKIGTGVTPSSGIFSFATTGLYQVMFTMRSTSGSSDTVSGETQVTQNNSSYDLVAYTANGDEGSGRVNTGTSIAFVNVTDTSNVKVKFAISSLGSGSTVEGATDANTTCFTFIRLGDSV